MLKVDFKDVKITFVEEVDACIYACNCKEIVLSNVAIEGVKEALIKSWGNVEKVTCENLVGIKNSTIDTDED